MSPEKNVSTSIEPTHAPAESGTYGEGLTAEQDAELDRLVDQGFNYRQARMKIGVTLEETGESEIPQSTKDADELQARAKKLASKYGGRPDDYDWRCQ